MFQQAHVCVLVIIHDDVCDVFSPCFDPSGSKLYYFVYTTSPSCENIVVRWVEIYDFALEILFVLRIQLDVDCWFRVPLVPALSRNITYSNVERCKIYVSCLR